MKHLFLAVDLGATSGRTVLGTVTDHSVSLEELTRFGHDIVSIGQPSVLGLSPPLQRD